MITNSDLELISCDAIAALGAPEAITVPAPTAPSPDDDGRDEVSRDAM